MEATVRRELIAATLATLLSCNPVFAQVGGIGSAAPGMGVTSPFGMSPAAGSVGPAGVPLGATELATPGLSPARPAHWDRDSRSARPWSVPPPLMRPGRSTVGASELPWPHHKWEWPERAQPLALVIKRLAQAALAPCRRPPHRPVPTCCPASARFRWVRPSSIEVVLARRLVR